MPIKIRPKFAIVVDGYCEFWYIQMLKRNEKSIEVNLEPKIPQKKKLSDQYEFVIELSTIYDKVFWIVDFDVIISETHTAPKRKTSVYHAFKVYFSKIKKQHKNIQIIINNPCLEFWLLLHFEISTRQFENCNKVISQLKKHEYFSAYEKSQKYYTKQDNDIYLRLMPFLNKATENAVRIENFNIENPFSAVSQMHLLFEALINQKTV